MKNDHIQGILFDAKPTILFVEATKAATLRRRAHMIRAKLRAKRGKKRPFIVPVLVVSGPIPANHAADLLRRFRV